MRTILNGSAICSLSLKKGINSNFYGEKNLGNSVEMGNVTLAISNLELVMILLMVIFAIISRYFVLTLIYTFLAGRNQFNVQKNEKSVTIRGYFRVFFAKRNNSGLTIYSAYHQIITFFWEIFEYCQRKTLLFKLLRFCTNIIVPIWWQAL